MVLLLALTLIAGGCKKNKAIIYSNTGVLADVDLALCPCCGGVILQKKDDAKAYRIESLSGITMQEFVNLSYPKNMRFNFKVNRECGTIIYLTITEYQFY
ncbi:MAG: hypothetical protein K2X48_08395 [Chitinophagaceae bacterium]|nr:hypothetical protein [Chitinophagaceae bacterium]